ncbi:MAG: ribonuclease Z [Candidatus Aenigmarchaeota archaeon]|nr:ribonuclease Z [Candidatus Aenigmarchaeota archaeon]
MLEIVFLGTGSGIPTRERNHSAIWLHYGEENMLWDCGEGTQRQMLFSGINPMKIDNIFITHWHADHWAGLIGYVQTMNFEGRKRPLYIHGPEAERFVADILDLGHWGPGFKVIAKPVQYEKDEETTIYESEDFIITSIPVKHTVPTVAYCFKERDSWNVDVDGKGKRFGLKEGRMIGNLKKEGFLVIKDRKVTLEDVATVRKGVKAAYSGDTMPCDNVIEISKDSDLMIVDSTFVENIEDRMHGTLEEVIEMGNKANAKNIALTHFSRRYSDHDEIVKEAKKYKTKANVIVAEDMMKLVFRKKGLEIGKVGMKD